MGAVLTAFWVLTAAATAGVIFDDFADGNDDDWTRYDPIAMAIGGSYTEFSVVNEQYRIQAFESPDPGQVGPARAMSLREDVVFDDFTISVDVVNFDSAMTNQVFGIFSRITNPGLGSTDGYGLLSTVGGSLELIRLENEEPVSYIDTAAAGALDPDNDYRLVFSGAGDNFSGAIYDLDDLTTPLATVGGTDANFTSGYTGLFVFDSSTGGDGEADATFDNFSAIPEPASAILLLLGSALWLYRRKV